MERLLVHLHIYYHDQVDFFIHKLKNINDIEWDLVVSFTSRHEDTIRKLKLFKPEVKFLELENYGYDIWPFIRMIKDTDLSIYSYVMKLHTKGPVNWCRPNIISLRGNEWRDALTDGLLYSPDFFKKNLEIFRQKPKIGMIYTLLSRVNRDYYDNEVIAELNRLGFEKKDKYTCMGTMFMMRSCVLKPLKSDLITEHMFRDAKPKSGSFLHNPHLYERIFSHLPVSQGYQQARRCPHKKDLVRIKFGKFLEPIGKFIFCCEREGYAHKKFVRVMGVKWYKEK